jgi:hypothetical protein
MKSLLRKKSPPDNRQKPSTPSVQNVRQPSSTETPLYARFASATSGSHPQEKARPLVSGPMPLGRPIPASLEANANRRRNGESVLLRHKPSNSHQEMPPAAQFPSSAVQRDLPSLPDGAYEDARVDLAEAPIQPKKAQANCTLCFSFTSVPRHSWLCQHATLTTHNASGACKLSELALLLPCVVYSMRICFRADACPTCSLFGRSIGYF